AREHGVPLPRLLDALSQPHLFQAALRLADRPDRQAAPGAPPLDLGVTFAETPSGLHGTIDYDADLFEPATVARLATHFDTLLAGIAPQTRLSALPLLPEHERRRML